MSPTLAISNHRWGEGEWTQLPDTWGDAGSHPAAEKAQEALHREGAGQHGCKCCMLLSLSLVDSHQLTQFDFFPHQAWFLFYPTWFTIACFFSCPDTPISLILAWVHFIFVLFNFSFGVCFDFLPLHRLPLGPQEIDPEKRAQRSAEQQQRQGEEGSDEEEEEAETVSKQPHSTALPPSNILTPLLCLLLLSCSLLIAENCLSFFFSLVITCK